MSRCSWQYFFALENFSFSRFLLSFFSKDDKVCTPSCYELYIWTFYPIGYRLLYFFGYQTFFLDGVFCELIFTSCYLESLNYLTMIVFNFIIKIQIILLQKTYRNVKGEKENKKYVLRENRNLSRIRKNK